MKKIRTITFHASYNYGSCLQSYALQEYIKRLMNNDVDYKIINLRTDIQKRMYGNPFKLGGFKNILKRIILFKHKKEIEEKQALFESFISNRLQLTKEYSSYDELKKDNIKSDYFIAGSDQLWNLQPMDFDWSYYLDFTNSGKKISYAASFGPKPQTWNNDEKERVTKDLKRFDCISVREEGSYNNVKKLIGIEPEINVDPTMLLETNDWNKIISKDKIYSKGKYIFLYNLKGNEISKIAKKISNELNLPIVVSKFGGVAEIFYGFKAQYNVGPSEFLNLIKNAELVLSSSFHGTIFSILLNKPFFAINGNKDFRINTLLKKMELEDRSISIDDYKQKCKNAYNISFNKSLELLKEEREKSEKYLENALDITRK